MNQTRYNTLLKLGYTESQAEQQAQSNSPLFIETVAVWCVLIKNAYRRFVRGFERVFKEWWE